ncbi:uncharacterized protein VDAG_00665 [Verticillium dahliae VdLs.17]|uniref:Uncharacterized protein n=1 Tax=Verticillium dahliae (strain VdLs.17 / ATCC MYA-4575 / FGSC 10137) TaxID=498257 RepID=G2WQM3_VERDV|nr:uncharacterized protein VDAG_00665 [Verticillium dahliae VdLs.17]EGY13983.1 hypothetical protein VDAG_00665 [Verticillium dahliae VdLs.17]
MPGREGAHSPGLGGDDEAGRHEKDENEANEARRLGPRGSGAHQSPEGGDASIATAQHDGDTGCYHTARKKPVWRPVCRSPGLHCPPATATGAGGRWCPSRTTGEEAKRGREEDAASRTAVGSTGKAAGRLQHAVTPSPASPNLALSTTDACVRGEQGKASAPPVPIPQGNISSSCLVAHLRPRCFKVQYGDGAHSEVATLAGMYYVLLYGLVQPGAQADPACSSRRSTGYVVAATRTTAPSGCSSQIVPHHHGARRG